ncbi:MAG: F-box protein: endocytic membrane traffic, recycling ReCYcling 1 [Phylliscum demangeonii]|nr:MAG: F-box protein: endocytic membrane traffic, recycling ReCYcling 1 [Phylliscum demangeonii]
MRKYAQVLVTLNGGEKGVECFIHKHPLLRDDKVFGDPFDCLNKDPSGDVSLEPSYFFFERLSTAAKKEQEVIGRVFPPPLEVFVPFLEHVGEVRISEYVTTLLDEVHQRNLEAFLKAVPGLYAQAQAFMRSLLGGKDPDGHLDAETKHMLARIFEPHVELYLQEELDFFKRASESEVRNWEQRLQAQDASAESFLMGNFNRQAVKKDFLSSFKKVVMMPVNVLPAFPLASSFTLGKAASGKDTMVGVAAAEQLDPHPLRPSSRFGTRPSQSSLPTSRSASPALATATAAVPPTTELAAKAALMNTRLEGIRSLFSIEVALNLIHATKASLDRAAVFVNLEGHTGGDAKLQCETTFVLLLQILHSRHVRPGFDKAVDHLSKYNPREVSQHNQPGVAPLVTFLELVNVGDLIQQMIDVFYEQELVAKKLVDRNDFLTPSVKEKRRFEQMLDERVAAGLNKGIDVLMEEVEYLCATIQQPTDYNPEGANSGNSNNNNRMATRPDTDLGPSTTARRVVEVVSSHTMMLTGTTDKNMLDVFNQEVGMRLFAALCKHLKRQRISVEGSIKLISDMNHYFTYIATLKNPELLTYFKALRELSQIYLVDGADAKDLATVIADPDRFQAVWRPEEVYEFAQRRADWLLVKGRVERAMYGFGCVLA